MGNRFRTTRWSVVRDAAEDDPEASRAALATLCEAYWQPLYAYARRRGSSPDDAADLVQGFLAALLEKGWLRDVDEARGRFRGFLATAFRRYATKEREKGRARKRGGGVAHVSLDLEHGESQYRLEPADERWTPERIFARRWALTVLQQVFDDLREEWSSASKAAVFDELAVFLGGHSPTPTHAEVAERVGMTTGAVKVAVHRLRKRYRALLREHVAATVSNDADVDDEIRSLIAALR